MPSRSTGWPCRPTPDFAEAHNNLGRALAQVPAGWPRQLRIRSRHPAETGLLERAQQPGKRALAGTGPARRRYSEYRTALRIRPDSASAHNNLGYALSQLPGSLAGPSPSTRKLFGWIPTCRRALQSGRGPAATARAQAEALAEFELVLRLKPSPRMQQVVDRPRTRK